MATSNIPNLYYDLTDLHNHRLTTSEFLTKYESELSKLSFFESTMLFTCLIGSSDENS